MLEDRAAKLEAEMAQLKAELDQKTYRGVWEPDAVYEPDNECTLRGSLWKCLQRTTARPGSDPAAWQLAVKSRGASDD